MNYGTEKVFTVQQTIGILPQFKHHAQITSDRLGWHSIFVSMQRERPYVGRFDSIDDYLIVLHREGPVKIQYELNGNSGDRMVWPGTLAILPAGCALSLGRNDSLATVHFYVRARYVREAAWGFTLDRPDEIKIVPRLGSRDELIEQALYAACDMMQKDDCSEWFADALARIVAGQLIRNHSTASVKMPKREHTLSQKRLRSIDDYIEAHLSESIRLTDMAAAASLSTTHFARQFKKTTGQSPHQYLLAIRVEAAKRLLRTDTPIAQIAFNCGFSHQEHLTRMFGRHVGMAPAAYRGTLWRG
jgi:AraC family transcriptional regulator